MNRHFIFQGSVPSDLEVVQEFLSRATNHLQEYVLDEDIFFDLRLIINELVVNGVLHGNRGNDKKSVSLDIDLFCDCIEIRVKDEGTGIFYKRDDCVFEELKCSGRGLMLVEALSDYLQFRNNEVIVIKKLG